MGHELVDWALAVLSVAAILVSGFGVYFLTHRDLRIENLEKKAFDNREDLAHIAGFLSGRYGYRPRT